MLLYNDKVIARETVVEVGGDMLSGSLIFMFASNPSHGQRKLTIPYLSATIPSFLTTS